MKHLQAFRCSSFESCPPRSSRRMVYVLVSCTPGGNGLTTRDLNPRPMPRGPLTGPPLSFSAPPLDPSLLGLRICVVIASP